MIWESGYIKKGLPKRLLGVKEVDGGISIELIDNNVLASDELQTDGIFTLKRVYYENATSPDLRKIISTLSKKESSIPLTLIQYVFKNSEHEVKNILPHGNSKKSTPFLRLKPTIIGKMKATVESGKTPKRLLDEAYTSVGDIAEIRSAADIPRGPSDMYNSRHRAKRRAVDNDGSSKHQTLWMVLERAKIEENNFTRDCTIHPVFNTTLYSDRQIDEMIKFLTDPKEFSVFGIDPTFNIFNEDLSLTVTSFRNLKLVNKKSGKPPVFIGPVFMHRKKDASSYSKFAYNIVSENESLASMLDIGTDGKKALVDGFRKNFRFSIFLRCFIHFRANIKTELSNRGLPITSFVEGIYLESKMETLSILVL